MSVLDHKYQVQKLLDNPDATIYFLSPSFKKWVIIKECTWRKSLRYLVVLPEHKHLMEALIAGKLQVLENSCGSWHDVPKNSTPDFEKLAYRVKRLRTFTIRPDSIEAENILQKAENISKTGVITVSNIVLGDDDGSA